MIITLAHAWAAFAILPMYVSLEKIDKSLLEAATDLGDGPVARFLRITLPLSMPGVIAATFLIFIPTTGDYITPALLGGPGWRDDRQSHPVAVRRGEQLADGSHALDRPDVLDRGDRAGLSLSSRVPCEDAIGHEHTRYIKRPNRVLPIYAWAFLIVLYVPILFIPLFSFNDSIYVRFPLAGFTDNGSSQLWNREPLWDALWNSVQGRRCRCR